MATRWPKIDLGSAVVVKWEDAWSNDADRYSSSGSGKPNSIDNEGPLHGEDIGYVIRCDKQGITLARQYFSSYRHVIHIPRAYVIKILTLWRGRAVYHKRVGQRQ